MQARICGKRHRQWTSGPDSRRQANALTCRFNIERSLKSHVTSFVYAMFFFRTKESNYLANIRTGRDHACKKNRILNIGQGMPNVEDIWQREIDFILRNSMFDIRYPFRKHGKSIILELPTAEELAKQLRFILPCSETHLE
jgi:hypothetical protein